MIDNFLFHTYFIIFCNIYLIQKGMGPGTIRHFENMRYLITLYNTFTSDHTALFPTDEALPDIDLVAVNSLSGY